MANSCVPFGNQKNTFHPHVTIAKDGAILTVAVADENEKGDRSLWGLSATLLNNMMIGVTKGYEKKLELVGVGYRAAMQGKDIKIEVGYSHPVIFQIPAGITATAEKTAISISGFDKQLVGELAAQIRRIRPPEPYKGKGIKYEGEQIRRKAGKAAKSAK
ncbi:MAG: 50S ribosomal protein L6 [Candidatus Magasanikbacteria bacterium]|nr:50S ribosomal protein L6 [Candidatus Magasanikbacteria bacterium]